MEINFLFEVEMFGEKNFDKTIFLKTRKNKNPKSN